MKSDYSRDSSVTELLDTVGWQSLETHRREARLLFKVAHGLVVDLCEGHIDSNHTKTSLKLNVYAPKTEMTGYQLDNNLDIAKFILLLIIYN